MKKSRHLSWKDTFTKFFRGLFNSLIQKIFAKKSAIDQRKDILNTNNKATEPKTKATTTSYPVINNKLPKIETNSLMQRDFHKAPEQSLIRSLAAHKSPFALAMAIEMLDNKGNLNAKNLQLIATNNSPYGAAYNICNNSDNYSSTNDDYLNKKSSFTRPSTPDQYLISLSIEKLEKSKIIVTDKILKALQNHFSPYAVAIAIELIVKTFGEINDSYLEAIANHYSPYAYSLGMELVAQVFELKPSDFLIQALANHHSPYALGLAIKKLHELSLISNKNLDKESTTPSVSRLSVLNTEPLPQYDESPPSYYEVIINPPPYGV